MADDAHRNIPAREPNPEPNPEPDAAVAVAARRANITPAHWDELFDAVTERLQASTRPAPLEPFGPVIEHPLGVPASMDETVQECVASLKRLHAALPR